MQAFLIGPAQSGKRSLLQRLSDGKQLGRPPVHAEILTEPRHLDSEQRLLVVLREGSDASAFWNTPVGLWARRCGADLWLLPEGADDLGMAARQLEMQLVLDQLGSPALGGVLTVLPQRLHCELWPRYFQRRLTWGLRYFELRDDLLTDAQILSICKIVPPTQLLISARRHRASDEPLSATLLNHAALWDWPLELGKPPHFTGPQPARIASLHRRNIGESLSSCIERLTAASDGAMLLKLAVPIHHLGELWQGHQWLLKDPARHQFLPSSPDGRWAWYRLWRGRQQQLNFWREEPAFALAPSPDQPTLFEWLQRLSCEPLAPLDSASPMQFAAILGDPVQHSRTPLHQQDFFTARGWPVLRIRLTDEDMAQTAAFSLLQQLGLRAAAVTSPRKLDARALVRQSGTFVVTTPQLPDEACNTLLYSDREQRWVGTNTDGEGLKTAWRLVRQQHPQFTEDAPMVLWGGGGTRQLMQSVFPQGIAYSARSGMPLQALQISPQSPKIVVWAVGATRQPACVWPPTEWQPEVVLDLNYSADSPGKQYAQRCGAHYYGGLAFFTAQAEAQRQFWQRYLPPR